MRFWFRQYKNYIYCLFLNGMLVLKNMKKFGEGSHPLSVGYEIQASTFNQLRDFLNTTVHKWTKEQPMVLKWNVLVPAKQLYDFLFSIRYLPNLALLHTFNDQLISSMKNR